MKGCKTGGRKKGSHNKKTIFVAPKAYPDGLDHLAAVMTSEDPVITPDLKLRAAIAIAAYQHAKPTSPRVETFIGPINYITPTTLEGARQAILELGLRVARHEISIETHDVLVGGIKIFLGDRAAEQEKRLAALEDALRAGES